MPNNRFLNASAKTTSISAASDNPTARKDVGARHSKKEKLIVPSEDVFNTHITTAGKLFMSKIRRHQAQKVDRRSRGFENGLQNKTLFIDPTINRHYVLLIIDYTQSRREALADALEEYFEVLVGKNNDHALKLMGMFKIDFFLIHTSLGEKHAIEDSPTLQFVLDMKKKLYPIPFAVMAATSDGKENEFDVLLMRLLQQGACGYFLDDVKPSAMIDGLVRMMTSIVKTQQEERACLGRKLSSAYRNQEEALTMQGIKHHGLPSRIGQNAIKRKPDSVVYDHKKMLFELQLAQRKCCLQQREFVASSITKGHSVLGVGMKIPCSDSDHSKSADELRVKRRLAYSSSPSRLTPKRKGLEPAIPPLPSQEQIKSRIYTKPHELQGMIQRHFYADFHTSKHESLPHDPLIHPCIVINPTRASANIGQNTIAVKAYHLYLEHRYEEALMECKRAIKAQSSKLVKLVILLEGVLYEELGKFDLAEMDFLKCLKLDDKLHEARYNLCVCRMQLGDDESALADISKALASDPDNLTYLRTRGLIYRRMGKLTAAQEEYAKAKELSSVKDASDVSTNTMKNANSLESYPHAYSVRNGLAIDMQDDLHEKIFGYPTEDKVALMCPPGERSDAMIADIACRLQSVSFFQSFPVHVVQDVAKVIEYDVIPCGKPFTLGEEHLQNFYIVLSGSISVRRKLGDLSSSITTHHIGAGMSFGCTGFAISSHATLVADELSEVGILWPGQYVSTIHELWKTKNNSSFNFLKQMSAFKLLSTSNLGHLVGISERVRFLKGEQILEQGQKPPALYILCKGTCTMRQDFSRPPLCFEHARKDQVLDQEVEDSLDMDNTGKEKVVPYHRFLYHDDWPFGFQVTGQRRNGRDFHSGRRNALLEPIDSKDTVNYAVTSLPSTNTASNIKRIRRGVVSETQLRPAALFGESGLFIDPQRTLSKCSVIAESIVEVLVMSHSQLHEMELTPEVISNILAAAPPYLKEEHVIDQKVQKKTWNEFKHGQVLELSKKRWPNAQKHLRMLSNGCSIIIAAQKDKKPKQSSTTEINQ